jgi:pimeloyl-ACP methyl ester carboxylesterase
VVPTVICDGTIINYHDVGRGDAVVLIHCSSSSHRQWRSLWELLQLDFRVISIDMLGWGATDPWSKGRTNLLADEASIISHVIKDLGDKIHLIGHSYGGTISYYFAMTSPDKVKSLTLIEPMLGWLLDPGEDKYDYNEIRGIAEQFWDKCASGKPEEGIEHYFDYWNGEGAWKALDQGVAKYVLGGAQKNLHEFEAIFEGGKVLPGPENFTQPTLLLGGHKSQSPPLRMIKKLEDQFPNARRYLIEGAAHMSPVTHSDEVNLIIRDFLST